MANLTCINCPLGCSLVVTKTKNGYVVSGNNCVRGENFAKEEMTCPKRVITALVKTKKGMASVKTTIPVPKTMIFDCLNEIDKIKVDKVKIGDILIKNILNTGADVVATKSV